LNFYNKVKQLKQYLKRIQRNSKELKANSKRTQSEFKANSKELKGTQSELKANSKRTHKKEMSTSTLAMRIKEIMVSMSDNLDTKKEIDEFYKNAMKDIKEKNNEEKKEKKIKKAEPKKRGKKVEVDDDGNEIVKVKKPLNKYQKFIQDNRKKVKEENPEMSGEEIFSLIAEMWGKHKEDIKNGVIKDDDINDDINDDIKVADSDKDSDDDIKVADDNKDSESDNDIKEEKKEKKAKKEKAPKKEKVDKKTKKEESS
jgi:hypothetical protein